MKVRELRVIDLRCGTCDAAPGYLCVDSPDGRPLPIEPHLTRIAEHGLLVAEGWHWQEIDPRDVGARGDR